MKSLESKENNYMNIHKNCFDWKKNNNKLLRILSKIRIMAHKNL